MTTKSLVWYADSESLGGFLFILFLFVCVCVKFLLSELCFVRQPDERLINTRKQGKLVGQMARAQLSCLRRGLTFGVLEWWGCVCKGGGVRGGLQENLCGFN